MAILGNLLSSLMPGGSADVFTGPTGLFTNPTGAWDTFKNGRTNEVNQAIAEENLKYQRERNAIEDARYEEETAYNRAFAEDERQYQRAFAEDERQYQREFAENQRDYERNLQQQIFEREDTALERQAESFAKMGINPLSQNMSGLGAGQAVSASGAPSPSSIPSSSLPNSSNRGGQALHNDFQMQDIGVLQALQPLSSMLTATDQMMTGNISRDGLRLQNDSIRLDNQAKEIENAQKEIRLQEELNNLKADTASKESSTKTENEIRASKVLNEKATAERNQRENMFQEKYGVSDGTDNRVRLITDLEKLTTHDRTIVDPPIKTATEAYTKPLTKAYKSVSKALSNTVGKGASAVYDYFSNLGKKVKEKSNKNKYHYYDSNGNKRSFYDEDERL